MVSFSVENNRAYYHPKGVAPYLFTDELGTYFAIPGGQINTGVGLINVQSIQMFRFSPNRNLFHADGNWDGYEIPLSEWEQAIIDNGIDLDLVTEKEAEFNS